MGENNSNKPRQTMNDNAVGLGIIFGTAIGAGLGIILNYNIAIAAGSGTGIGIVIGAIISAYNKKSKM